MARPKELNPIRRAERDARIKKYHEEHPGVALRAIGRIYKLSVNSIIRIVRKETVSE